MDLDEFIRMKKLSFAAKHPDKIDEVRKMIERFGLEVDLDEEAKNLERFNELLAAGHPKAVNMKKLLK